MWNPMRRTEATGGLVDIIHEVRRRWRYKLALRGAVGVLGSASPRCCCRHTGWSRGASAPARSSRSGSCWAWRSPAWSAGSWCGRCCDSVTDEQVALYLEEHEPSLQAAIISAVEMSAATLRAPLSPRTRPRWSSAWCESAVEKCQAIDRRTRGRAARRCGATPAPSRRLPSRRSPCSRSGPAYLRHALSALLIVSRSVEAAAPYRIEVTPGNATVPQGADQTITAKLTGFDAEQAALMVRKSPDAPFERMSLAAFGDGDGRASVRGHAVRSGRADRLLRRSGRRAIDHLQAEGRRPAVRAEARARVSLPGVHRPRAAEGRGRRRHRRAEGAPRSACTSCRR